MNVQAKSIAALIMALCLVWAIGAAGTAFADEPASTPDITAGEISSDPEEGTEPEPEPEPEPVHADGWEQIDSSWTYWKDNVQVKGKFITTEVGPGIKGAKSGAQKYWIANDGTLAISRLVDPADDNDAGAKKYYYATKYGYVAKGKTVVGDKMYLADKTSGKLWTGNAKGFLSTKKFDNGKRHRYYINPKTRAVTLGKPVYVRKFGWTFSYPGKKKGYLLTGLTKVDKTHVVLATKQGKLRNKAGWVYTNAYTGKDKQRYYLNRTKKYKSLYGARIGTFKVKGKRYYGQSKGYVYRDGYKKMNNNYYRADNKGVLTYDGIVTNMYKKAQGYTSPSKYLLMVDIDNPKTIVFEGSKYNWKPKFIWDCCTGAPATPTVEGTYSVGIKGPSFGEDRGFSCYTYTQISGDYLFHTRIYYAGTHTLMEKDDLGNRHSHGCVHLLDENAKWIQDNVPSGTTIACIR